MQVMASDFFLKVHFLASLCASSQSLDSLEAHSRMGHYFFSYLLTWEVDLIEILDIIPLIWQ